ncbi:MAG TPA: cytochrome c [Gemmatimonadales bacterium]
MVTPTAKKILLSVLLTGFVVQTALVYSDERHEPLSNAAVRGREIWHRDACQVCHQLYGNGGFLGPDLTNAFGRVDPVRLRSLLTVGSGQMPAFRLTDDEVNDVREFLRSMDRPDLGRGELRLGTERGTPWARFAGAVSALQPEATVRRGWTAFATRACTGCHQPLAPSPTAAPDLSLATQHLDRHALLTVLTGGRVERGMPSPVPAFEPGELNDVIAFIGWMAVARDAIAQRMAMQTGTSMNWRALPWWEYR